MMPKVEPPEIFLVDNGSLRPEATLALRELATALSERVGGLIQPVSLLHSHKIDADLLGGEPATILKRALRHAAEGGKRRFIILPLFLGPSRAVIDYVPQVIEEVRAKYADLEVTIAQTLAGGDVDAPDPRLAEMIEVSVRQLLYSEALTNVKIALVDHGTPYAPVNSLRNAVASQLAERLHGYPVCASSMERRDAPEYDFNEPLLERVDQAEGFSEGCLIVAMFFLLPGRHAGDGGDVSEICEGLCARGVFDQVIRTPLLGEDSMLLEILADRLAAVR
ncbi:MAG: sirohydrochlorin chelatase [Coraliomargarita sp.]